MVPIEHLFRSARRTPEALAVIEGERSLTYRDLVRKVDALATALQALDPTPLSRVGICAHNSVEHLIAWAATFAAGKTWVPLNPRNGRTELDDAVEAVRPTILVVDESCLDKLSTEGATLVVANGGKGDGRTVVGLVSRYDGETPVRHIPEPDDVQAIKFTGGSSGRPKGVMQTYRVWNTCVATMMASYDLDTDERHLVAMPMTHAANTLIMPTFAKGGTQVFMGTASPAAILDAFGEYRITSLFLPPTVVTMMMAEPGIEDRAFPTLKHVIVGGDALRPAQVPKAMALFNNALESCYGQTEAPQICACMRAHEWRDERYWASCGRPTLLTRMAIMDAAGTLVPAGEEGEIVVRGDLVMKGYLDMPEKTAETIVDGWLHTGDVGLMDERGYVFVRDRLGDMVITGGFNVYPNDVEAVLGRHPAVRDCMVFGVPDAKWGERIEAAVELHDGAVVMEDDLVAFVKRELDPVKAPKTVHVLDSLPRSSVGKVLRRKARALFGTPRRKENQ